MFPLAVKNQLSAHELIKLVDYEAKLLGEDRLITHISAPQAISKGSLVFVEDMNPRLATERLGDLKSGIAVIKLNTEINPDSKSLIVTEKPRIWFIKSLSFLLDKASLDIVDTEDSEEGIQYFRTREISARCGNNTFIASTAIIGNGATIGHNCYIGPNTMIGDNVQIGHNTVVGITGLGFVRDVEADIFFPHLGNVIVGDNVTIGSSCSIVRGQLKSTIIGERSLIGNQVNVGHNVEIGSRVFISANCCITGGGIIHSDTLVGAGSVFNSKIQVGQQAIVGMGSVVTKSVKEEGRVFGNPARPLRSLGRF